MKNYPRIMGEILNKPWLITPDKFETICGLIETRLTGGATMNEGEAERLAAVHAHPEVKTPSQVAVMPLWGTLFQHAGLMQKMSGGTSTAEFGRAFKAMMGNPDVGTIVLHVNSPGGQVWGTHELSDLIYNSRGQGKKIVAVADSQMASAALEIGTSADEVYVTTGGELGSMGVVQMHADTSAQDEKVGIKRTLIAVPERKIEGHPYGPLSEDAAKTTLELVEKTYEQFASRMARNMGVSIEYAKGNYGGGGMLQADEAKSVGLVKEIAPFDDVMDEIISQAQSQNRAAKSVRNRLALAKAEG